MSQYYWFDVISQIIYITFVSPYWFHCICYKAENLRIHHKFIHILVLTSSIRVYLPMSISAMLVQWKLSGITERVVVVVAPENFPSYSTQMRDSISITRRLLPSKPFPVHHSFYHSTLYSLEFSVMKQSTEMRVEVSDYMMFTSSLMRLSWMTHTHARARTHTHTHTHR
jgi:hypothetical protein